METIQIGNQVWMSKNLDVDRFSNGDLIPEANSKEEWNSAGKNKQPAWCYYANDPENGKKYGKLYNWYAVNDERGLAPKGWHIPTKKEFDTLKKTVNNDGNALKSVGQGSDGGTGTNTSGFSALLTGYRYGDGYFGNSGYIAYFWISTKGDTTTACSLSLFYSSSNIYLHYFYEGSGFSVRCVKD